MHVDSEKVRARLLAMRSELLRDDEVAASGRATVMLDQTSVGRLSRMDALQGQQMALAAQRRRQMGLVRIAQALTRLDDGDYGYCISCGEEIAPKRLEHDPAAPTCLRCAARADKR
jgi:DnaK suppressor protein